MLLKFASLSIAKPSEAIPETTLPDPAERNTAKPVNQDISPRASCTPAPPFFSIDPIGSSTLPLNN